MLKHNQQMFRENDIERIIWLSPHDYEMFLNSYEDIENIVIEHYTEAIWGIPKQKRGYIGPAVRALANKPEVLKMFADRIAMLWGRGTKLDRKTRLLIYLAVSIMNNWERCIFSFTYLLKNIGFSDEECVELYSIIDAACGMNMLLSF